MRDETTLARKRRIEAYVKAHGGPAAVARLAGCTPSHVSQLKGDKYAAGEVAVRRLARDLFLPEDYFDRDDAPVRRHDPGVVEVPLYEWEDVGTTKAPTGVAHTDVGGVTFAVRMRGDSMTAAGPRPIPEGALVFVDAGAAPKVGDVVLARLDGAGAPLCRQLVEDGGTLLLRPLNTAYPMVRVEPHLRLLGVVRAVHQAW